MKRLFLLAIILFPLMVSTQQWYQLYPDIDVGIYNVFCVDAYNVYCTGYSGPLIKTTDGGISWEIIDDLNFVKAMYFIDQDTGYVGGVQGNIYRTEDGGENWIIQSLDSINNSHVRDIKMLSADTIFVCMSLNYGLYYSIFRSSDGGQNWEMIKQSDIESTLSMHFFNNGCGYILEPNWASFSSKIFKTTDFGSTWLEISSIEGNTNIIYFIDTLQGFIGSPGYDFGTLIHQTIDGGNTWEVIDTTDAHYITRFDFPDPSIGYFSGRYVWSKLPWGLVEMSVDHGNSWDEIFFTNDIMIYSLDYVGEDSGYVVGEGTFGYEDAFIMRTFDVEVSTEKNEYQKDFELFVTPNPFRQKTTIHYKLSKPGNVEITISDLYNSIVEEFSLGYRSITDNTFEINLSTIPSGVYFLTLILDGEKQKTTKILKVE